MKLRAIIVVCSAVLFAVSTAYSLPIGNTPRVFKGMFPRGFPTSRVKAPSATGFVRHLIADSLAQEGGGSAGRVYYGERGWIDSVITWEKRSVPSTRTTFSYGKNGGVDTMTVSTWSDGRWVYDSKWIFLSPLPHDFFPDYYDRLSEGQGMVEGTSQLYHLQLSTASSLGMLWDSRLSEWHGYKKDTVIDDGSGMKIYRSEARDTASSSWWPEEIDTFFFRDGRITQARVNYYADGEWDRSRSSFVYNDRGFISENTYEYWSPAMQSWVFESRRKLTYAFNGRGDLDTFRFQDWNPSDGVWGSLDSASGIISSYVYDASGAIVSRTDSTFGSRYISSKSTHYFKFRDFPLPVKSAPRSPNAPGRPVTVFSDGRIVLQSMGEEALCARLLTPSGRLVAGFPLREGLNLKTCKRMHGIKGFFLLRIMEEKHGNPVGDWRIFLP